MAAFSYSCSLQTPKVSVRCIPFGSGGRLNSRCCYPVLARMKKLDQDFLREPKVASAIILLSWKTLLLLNYATSVIVAEIFCSFCWLSIPITFCRFISAHCYCCFIVGFTRLYKYYSCILKRWTCQMLICSLLIRFLSSTYYEYAFLWGWVVGGLGVPITIDNWSKSLLKNRQVIAGC